MICPFRTVSDAGHVHTESCVRQDCALWVNSMGYVGCAFLIQALKGLKPEEA